MNARELSDRLAHYPDDTAVICDLEDGFTWDVYDLIRATDGPQGGKRILLVLRKNTAQETTP